MRAKVSAFLKFVDLVAIQKGIGSVGLGLLYSHEAAPLPNDNSILKFIFAFLGMVFILFNIMTLNDYFDAEIDKLKGERQALAEIPKKLAGVSATVFLFLGLLFAWLASPTYLAISLILVILSTAYSAPPIRYKEVYPFSTFGEISGAFLLFLAGYSLLAPIEVRALVVSLIPCLLMAYGRLRHEVRYVQFDRDTEKKTIAVVHGVGIVKLLMRLCILSIIALSLGLLLISWFSVTFLFFLMFLIVGSFHMKILERIVKNTSRREIWLIDKAWGFVYFLIVLVFILFS